MIDHLEILNMTPSEYIENVSFLDKQFLSSAIEKHKEKNKKM